jgi:hypothetical protein
MASGAEGRGNAQRARVEAVQAVAEVEFDKDGITFANVPCGAVRASGR